MTEFLARFFRYVGEPTLTRGDYGVYVSGGHNTPENPDEIGTFDPDYGDRVFITIEAGLASGEWIEISEEEWKNL